MIIIEKDLTRMSTIRVESIAKYYCEPTNIDDLKEAVLFSKRNNLKLEILGRGSNILFSKSQYNDRIFLKLIGDYSFFNIKNDCIDIGAVYSLKLAGKKLIEKGYEDYIFFNLIPGSIGGAITQNAGVGKGLEIKNLCIDVKLFDYTNNKIIILDNSQCIFSYRDSIIKKHPNQYIVLSAKFNSDNMTNDILTLIEKTKKSIKDKIEREPIGYSFGSTFKNNQIAAWKCIKEIKKSLDPNKGAFFSDKHNNWIINENANGRDIYALIKQAQKLAKKTLDIDLETEVKII